MKALLWCAVLTGFWGLNAGASGTPTIKDRWTQCKIEGKSLKLTSVKLDRPVERNFLNSAQELKQIQKNPAMFSLQQDESFPQGWTYEVARFGGKLKYKSTAQGPLYHSMQTTITAYFLIGKTVDASGKIYARARLCAPKYLVGYDRRGKESFSSFTFDRCMDFIPYVDPGYAGWSEWFDLDVSEHVMDGEIVLQQAQVGLGGVLLSGAEAKLVCEAQSEIR